MIHPISILHRVLDRVFPKSPDFFKLLADQAQQVTHTVNLLVDFMGTDDAEIGKQIRKDEHAADAVKVHNIHTLNEAFSTDIDREDIYRAIVDLDEIVNYCKDCVNEMDALAITPDKYTYELAAALRNGCQTLATGFAKLGSTPADAAVEANIARKHGRSMEKLYRRALAELFQGEDYMNMLKRREIYQHLDRAGGRLEHCANTLHDIVVKIG
ncbi:DUF47 family protein [Parasulfuritortus cantonensis]|uniref:DUF47 family protein n=1 Tax=Parasulfuritortus cantonensis TaxID=2528202 RepID=A0A4R1B7S1_9PROT|nr:DUF47 family protein [Parasulfuritortus cantonensis]TCJ13177.1 DUF47 family protein [Parasulfuritortus cantonensis]